jgi:photosystem II stability/assembly factor-like uncharacterized protein
MPIDTSNPLQARPAFAPLRWLSSAFVSFAFSIAIMAADGARPRVLLMDATLAGSDIVTVGEHGSIFRSADSGRTWSASSSPERATLTGVSFGNERLGWAVGHDALILATVDGGRTWNPQWRGENLEDSFLDVCALDARHVIAIGAYNLCLVTHDGGRTWQTRRILDEDMHLNRISRGPTGTLYLAGERGTLLRSVDAGETWTILDAPYEGSFYGILPLSANVLLAYGLRGNVFRSDNDGDSWDRVPLDSTALLATGLKTRRGPIVLAGQARTLLVSNDGGRSFDPAAQCPTAGVAELLETPDGSLLAAGEAGVTAILIRR